MPAFLKPLAEGIATYLANAGIGLAWQPEGVYPNDGTTPIFVLAVPQTPDQLLTLTPYPLGDDPSLSNSTVGLQVRSRSGPDPGVVMDLDDAIADQLLGNYPLTLQSGVRITTLVRAHAVSLGQDDSNRWGWSSNYVLGLYRPGPHRY